MKAKRLFSFLLALMMVTTLLGGAVVPVSANEPTVPVIEISGIPGEPVIGGTVVSGNAIVPEGAGYTAEYYWYRYNGAYYNEELGSVIQDWGVPIYEEETVEDRNDYNLFVEIEVDDNWAGWEYYVPGEDLDVQINVNGGEKVWIGILSSYNVESGYNVIYYSEYFYFSEELTTVEITGVQEAVSGEIASVEGIQVPENAPYSITGADWENYNDSSLEPITGEAFLPEEFYNLEVFLLADMGYHFAEDCVVYINGVQSDEYYLFSSYQLVAQPTYDTRLDIDTVEISYTVEPPVAGEAPFNVDITTPEDANYLAWCSWYKFNSEEGYWESRVDIFEEGEEYLFGITIWPNTGYGFTEDVVVIANGTVLEGDAYYNDDGWRLSVDEFFVAEAAEPTESIVIDSVMISDFQAPVPGEPLDESVTVLTEGCTAELNWSVYDGEGVLPVTGTAEKGKEYCLDITLTADEGYSFAEEIEIWLDGERSWGYSWGGNTVEQSFWYDTLEVIESVEITSTDKAELGAAASAHGASVPEGANYSVSAYWGVLDMESGVMPFTGEFADNTVYTYMLDVKPADGYKFADDVTVTYNGEPVQEDFYYGGSSSLEVVGQVFTGTMQRINKVEINAKFKAGMKASDAAVTVPENAGYEITEYLWVDLETGEAVEGSFVEGKQYGLIAYVAPKEGYVIELGAQTVINGTDEYEYMESMYAYLYGYTQVIMDCEAGDTDNGPSAGNTDGNPSTGDDSQIALPLILMVLSAIGLVSVLTTKPRKYRG